MIRSLFLFFLVVASCNSLSLTLDELLSEAENLKLSSHPQWLALGVYKKQLNLNSYKSAIKSQNFFLANDGRTNPESELRETLKAFFQTGMDNPNEHPLCKFRGRYFWLKEKLNLEKTTIPKVACPDFEAWSLNGKTQSISIVFASGYLKNPASYYGHMLLKMNGEPGKQQSRLEDVTVNYGAIDTEHDGTIIYILKGLFGGYDAGFSHIQFYYHTHNYGQAQNRNLWEYELNLSPSEVELVLGHTWEVLGKKYTYYFLARNCAYRMGELIDILEGVKVTPSNPVWVMPQSILQKISSEERDGRKLVRHVQHHPSRQDILHNRFSELNSLQKQTVRRIVKDFEEIEHARFAELQQEDQLRVVDTLIDYYNFMKTDSDEEIYESRYNSVLLKRFSLPPANTNLKIADKPAPHNGRKPSRTSISHTQNDALGDITKLQIRPAYYDALDGDSAHIANAELRMGELNFGISESNSFYLEHLKIVSVSSVANSVTNLPGDSGENWKIEAGIRQARNDCNDCLTPYFSAEKGVGKTLLDSRLFLGGYIGLGIQSNQFDYGTTFANSSFKLNFKPLDRLGIHLKYGYMDYLNSHTGDALDASFTFRYKLHKNSDLRFEYKKMNTEEKSIVFGFYW